MVVFMVVWFRDRFGSSWDLDDRWSPGYNVLELNTYVSAYTRLRNVPNHDTEVKSYAVL